MRIWIVSDIHVDFVENQQWVQQLSDFDYQNDILILAGDITHRFSLLRQILSELKKKFKRLFFVPGNHDLWIRDEKFSNSLEKFLQILDLCQDLQIETRSGVVTLDDMKILVVPLFSWYHFPEEAGSLYLPKPGEAPLEKLWSDHYFVKWPSAHFKPVEYFFNLNKSQVQCKDHNMVITFSHFLPRQETMFSEDHAFDRERMKKFDRHPQFNFSQVAGSSLIEKQLRYFQSNIHVYGHQHVNRDRVIDNVRYVSHCLGYPDERRRGSIEGIEEGLKRLWPPKE